MQTTRAPQRRVGVRRARTRAATIEAANRALLVDGRLDAVGDFRGFPATGRRLVWRDLVASRFRGDRIAED